jgi:type I restriction enzyme S subunit
MTVGLQNLSNQNFYNVRSLVPPVEEQLEIVSFAEKSTKQQNGAISAAQREITLLREYRTRLIADLVTGKLDVRATAAGLPEEAGEPDAPDEIEELAEGDQDTTNGEIDAAAEEADP